MEWFRVVAWQQQQEGCRSSVKVLPQWQRGSQRTELMLSGCRAASVGRHLQILHPSKDRLRQPRDNVKTTMYEARGNANGLRAGRIAPSSSRGWRRRGWTCRPSRLLSVRRSCRKIWRGRACHSQGRDRQHQRIGSRAWWGNTVLDRPLASEAAICRSMQKVYV